MLLRVTVSDWHRDFPATHVRERVLAEGLAQNVETINRPQIFGDFVQVDDPVAYLNKVRSLQAELECRIAVEVG